MYNLSRKTLDNDVCILLSPSSQMCKVTALTRALYQLRRLQSLDNPQFVQVIKYRKISISCYTAIRFVLTSVSLGSHTQGKRQRESSARRIFPESIT